jgi:osmoprotectant transport system ATP-binding protein
VLRNVALVPWLQGSRVSEGLARDALALVGLEVATFGERYPHELSGGQRQRVAMARALAGQPRVVLLDEPFGALDAITRADLQATFVEIRRALSVTALLVTHDLREAFRLADRVVVMRAGHIEQEAPPAELTAHPGTPYVTTLLERALA